MCVRRLLPLFLVAALAAPAAAESTVGSPQASAVAIMRDSGQALLWDSARGEYLLVKAGDHFQGYFVVTISEASVVVADEEDPRSRHVLRLTTAPTSHTGKARASKPTVITLAPPALGGADLDVVDPYPADGLEVVDPYSGPPGATPRTVAPTVVFSDGAPKREADVREVRAPAKSAVDVTGGPGAPSYDTSDLDQPAPEPAARPADPAPAEPKRVERTVKVSRGELDAALSDFDALGKEVQIERAEGGGVEIIGLSRGSFFHRVGVRENDVVRSIAGVRLTTIESAAVVYTRVKSTDAFAVVIDRGRKQVVLNVVVR